MTQLRVMHARPPPLSEAPPSRKGSRGNKAPTEILKAWILENEFNPYPSPAQKDELMAQTGLSRSQLDHWFTNARQRYVRPRNRRGPNPNYSRYPQRVTKILIDWLTDPEHVDNPYPTLDQQTELMNKTKLSKRQLQNWFTNARKRSLASRIRMGTAGSKVMPQFKSSSSSSLESKDSEDSKYAEGSTKNEALEVSSVGSAKRKERTKGEAEPEPAAEKRMLLSASVANHLSNDASKWAAIVKGPGMLPDISSNMGLRRPSSAPASIPSSAGVYPPKQAAQSLPKEARHFPAATYPNSLRIELVPSHNGQLMSMPMFSQMVPQDQHTTNQTTHPMPVAWNQHQFMRQSMAPPYGMSLHQQVPNGIVPAPQSYLMQQTMAPWGLPRTMHPAQQDINRPQMVAPTDPSGRTSPSTANWGASGATVSNLNGSLLSKVQGALPQTKASNGEQPSPEVAAKMMVDLGTSRIA